MEKLQESVRTQILKCLALTSWKEVQSKNKLGYKTREELLQYFQEQNGVYFGNKPNILQAPMEADFLTSKGYLPPWDK